MRSFLPVASKSRDDSESLLQSGIKYDNFLKVFPLSLYIIWSKEIRSLMSWSTCTSKQCRWPPDSANQSPLVSVHVHSRQVESSLGQSELILEGGKARLDNSGPNLTLTLLWFFSTTMKAWSTLEFKCQLWNAIKIRIINNNNSHPS